VIVAPSHRIRTPLSGDLIVQALFAQAPAPQFDYYTMLVPAGPLGIVSVILNIVSLVCFILVLVKMFQHGQTGLGIATAVTALCGIGFLIAFVYGWVKSAEWNLKTVMLAWTAVVVISIALSVYISSTVVVVRT
jgi:hypothetical protein